MSPRLLSSNVVFEDEHREERIEMNDWKLGSAPRGTMSGWGYRESRFLPKPAGRVRRALNAATSAMLTLVGHTLSR
jgi:hypothetical protein